MQMTIEQALARIEALEKHKRLQTEDVMNLGAQLGQACLRIEQLEAALRAIVDLSTLSLCEDINSSFRVNQIARAALDQSSPPEASD